MKKNILKTRQVGIVITFDNKWFWQKYKLKNVYIKNMLQGYKIYFRVFAKQFCSIAAFYNFLGSIGHLATMHPSSLLVAKLQNILYWYDRLVWRKYPWSRD